MKASGFPGVTVFAGAAHPEGVTQKPYLSTPTYPYLLPPRLGFDGTRPIEHRPATPYDAGMHQRLLLSVALALLFMACDDVGDGALAPAGMCMNAEDGAILGAVDVAAVTSDAATACYLGGATEDASYVACTSEALIDETGLTAGCVDCFVQSALCAKNNCLVECLSDPVACETCREENGCISAFYECSGLPVPE